MIIQFTARKTQIDQPFKDLAEKKLTKLDRFFGDETRVQVTVSVERERETVEITITDAGITFRAEKTTADRNEALDMVVDALFKQITRNKGKIANKMRTTHFDKLLGSEQPEEVEEEYHLVRTKQFFMKPMSAEEAILEMNLIGHSFFMFYNCESDKYSVIYRRDDGDYGLIEPEDIKN